MRKITLMLASLFACLTASLHAQDGQAITGLTSLPTEKVSFENSTTGGLQEGYYLIKNVNSNRTVGFLKATSAAVGAEVNAQTADPAVNVAGDAANYIWHVTVDNTAGTISIATANDEAYWKEPTRNAIPLQVAASKGNIKITTENHTLNGGTSALPDGACLMWGTSSGYAESYYHFNSANLASWDDCNPNSLGYFEFYEIEEANLMRGTYVDITYNYIFNGKNVGTETINTLKDFPFPATTMFLAKNYIDITLPEGNVAATGTYDVALNVSSDFPFQYAASYDEINQWYYLKLKDQSTDTDQRGPVFASADPDVTDKYPMTTDNKYTDGYLWAFVGNPVEGFEIVNKATGSQTLYLAANSGDNSSPLMSGENTTKWLIEKSNRSGYSGRFGIRSTTSAQYLNNFSNNGYLATYSVGPTDDAGSNVYAIEEVTNITLPLTTAIADAKLYPIGTALGQFHDVEDGDYAAALAAAEELVSASPTPEQVSEMVSRLQTAVAALEINQPEVGKFYRFHARGNAAKRMSSIPVENDNNFIQMITDNTNCAQTVFYLNENRHLVALSGGLCLGNFNRDGKNNGYWTCVLESSDKVGTITFQASRNDIGSYNLVMPGDRYLHNASAKVDCGGSDGDGYRWDISEVTWLPIEMNTEVKYGTFYSPVAVEKSYSRVKAYKGTLSGDYIVLEEIEGNIPANTPVVLEYVQGITDGAVYLQTLYGNTDGAIESDLAGSVVAVERASAVPDGGDICTLQLLEDESVGFFGFDGENLSGFKAYLPIADAQQTRSYTIRFGGDVTGINGAAVQEQPETFYDLNGRRVLYPTKGIYVTASGKKVLFK